MNIKIAAFGLITLLLLSGTVSIACAGDWPMFQHDPHHTGYTDDKVSDDLELMWSFSLKSGGQPTVANGKVFVGSGDHKIYCLDENTGDLIWSYETGNKVPSTPAVADEKIFIGSGDGKIYCLNENNGNLIWSHEIPGRLYGLAVADGKVFVNSGNKLLCFGAKKQLTPKIPTGKEEKETPGFEVVFTLAGILAVAYLLRSSRK